METAGQNPITDVFADKNIRNYVKEKERTKSEKLFSYLASITTGGKTNIDVYDSFVDDIPEIMKERSFEYEGTKIKFTDAYISKPKDKIGRKEIDITPEFCRRNGYSYSGDLVVSYDYENKIGEKGHYSNINIGKIPVMLGSKICHLRNMSVDQLLDAGECFSDPFGYFIIKSERSVITQDQARPNKFITAYDNKKVRHYMSYTTETVIRSNSMTLTHGKKRSLKVIFQFTKETNNDHSVPIFNVFKFLGETDLNECLKKYILPFVPKEHKRRVEIYLLPSRVKSSRIDHVKNLAKKLKQYNYTEEMRDNISIDLTEKIFENLIFSINTGNRNKDINMKLYTFGYMIARFTLFKVNVIPIDNRDSWANKVFKPAGILVRKLLNSILDDVFKGWINGTRLTPSTLETMGKKFINTNFENSLNTAKWGVKGKGWIKDNYAVATERMSPIALCSINNKTDSTIYRRTKDIEKREINSSQSDSHCPSETPEGDTTGLVKFISVTARFSLDRKEEEIKRIILSLMSKNNTKENNSILLLNSKVLSKNEEEIWFCDKNFRDVLIKAKRNGILPFDIEIDYDDIMNSLQIFCDNSRLISPFLVVEDNELVIETKKMWNVRDIDILIKEGCIEYLSPAEKEYEKIICSREIEYFYEKRKDIKFSHCYIDPGQILSITALMCPFPGMSPNPRVTYQSAMSKQSMTAYNFNYHKKFYPEFKILDNGSRAFTETDLNFIPRLNMLPNGQTVMVAFSCDPENQEDGVVISDKLLESGLFCYTRYRTVKYHIGTNEVPEELSSEYKPGDNIEKYQGLGDDGLPMINSYISEGDYILGKVKIDKTTGTRTPDHLEAGVGEEGYVDAIMISVDKKSKNLLIKIRLKDFRQYQAGDKQEARYSQKGVVMAVRKHEEMIRVNPNSKSPNAGIHAELLYNPLGFPSRQTVGLIMEGLINKACVYSCENELVGAFKKVDIEKYKDILEKNGMDRNGYEEMQLPIRNDDGSMSYYDIKNKIFFVPMYICMLKHHVKDKIQLRSVARVDSTFRAPIGGRAIKGSQRIGEMEKDAFVAYGATSIIQEKMMTLSNEFKLKVCINCGNFITSVINNCDCGNPKPGVLRCPYTLNLLFQYLNGLGVYVRIKTKILEN